jgi:hypothetical protein
VRRSGRGERLVFTTYKPPDRAPEWEIGRVVEREGRFYRVTRWEEGRMVPLERGGSVREWRVWGRKVSSEEVCDDLADAVSRFLEDQPE